MKAIFWAAGWISLGLGVLGLFLPLLPTTPFLLLAALCFSRASPRLHRWLLAHPQFGPMITDWQNRRVIPLRAKIVATVLMLPTILLATFWGIERPPALRIGLLVLAAGVMLFVWTKKSR